MKRNNKILAAMVIGSLMTGYAAMAADTNVVYDDSTKAGITLGDAGTRIKNVADGIADKDAVNKSQLDAVDKRVSTNTQDINTIITDNITRDGRIDTAISTANTAKQHADAGYHFLINGKSAVDYNWSNNDMNFIEGDNVKIETGSTTLSSGGYGLAFKGLKFSVTANGKVEAGNTGLVTGGMVKDAINLATEGIATDANVANKADKDLSNISDGAWSRIEEKATAAASGAVANKANADGTGIDVNSWREKLASNNIEEGDMGLVTGDMMYSAMKTFDNSYAYTDAMNLSDANVASWQEKLSIAKKDASNIDASAWQDVLGTGKNAAGDKGLITGATLNEALAGYTGGKSYTAGSNVSISEAGKISVKPTGSVEKDNGGLVTGGQVEAAIKEATKNIASDATISAKADKTYVDDQLKTKADSETVNKALEGKANTDLSNISDAGKTAIKNVLKDDLDKKADISYVNTELGKKADADNVYTKKETEDKIASAVSGVNTSLAGKADKSYVDTELGKKADASTVESLSKTVEGHGTDIAGLKDGSAIDAAKYAEKLGTGEITDGNKNLVNGGTVFNAINELKENTGAGLVVVKDGAVRVASDSEASKVDFAGKNGARVLTGVATDANDATSAANVGYVNSQAQALEAGMNAMNNKLTDDIKNAGAVSAALAGLHHLDYDPDNKLDVAAAMGHYRGKSAAALGFFYQPNENMMVSAGATLGGDDNAFNAGLSFKVGKGSSYGTTSKAAMAAEIKQLKADKDAQAAEIQELKDQVALLMQKMELSTNVEKSIVK